MSSSYDQAIALINQAHAADPKGKEASYGQSIVRFVNQLRPDADDALKIAAVGQHLERWAIPRDDFPRDRTGYLKWRASLHLRQGERMREILPASGLAAEEIERIAKMVAKKDKGVDGQTLEDAACLVFLDEQAADFAAKYSEEKIIGIIQKTWAKMSTDGQAMALTLQLPDAVASLVQKALA